MAGLVHSAPALPLHRSGLYSPPAYTYRGCSPRRWCRGGWNLQTAERSGLRGLLGKGECTRGGSATCMQTKLGLDAPGALLAVPCSSWQQSPEMYMMWQVETPTLEHRESTCNQGWRAGEPQMCTGCRQVACCLPPTAGQQPGSPHLVARKLVGTHGVPLQVVRKAAVAGHAASACI